MKFRPQSAESQSELFAGGKGNVQILGLVVDRRIDLEQINNAASYRAIRNSTGHGAWNRRVRGRIEKIPSAPSGRLQIECSRDSSLTPSKLIPVSTPDCRNEDYPTFSGSGQWPAAAKNVEQGWLAVVGASYRRRIDSHSGGRQFAR